ncbi:hypothetical protein [Streptomyces platensis]|uniref:hypothetical protein n=1 Tax=Streptomyces platensis TaxID=58346 RepID=UPI0036B74DAB
MSPQSRDWYWPLDLLPGGIEASIDADSTLTDRVDRIMLATGLEGVSGSVSVSSRGLN